MSPLPESLLLAPENLALATDFYQLTMMASYFQWKMEEDATFELFVRRLPKRRAFLIAAGLEQCLHYLRTVHFDGAAVDYLRAHEVFAHADPAFFERLRAWRFGGDLDAVREGTPIFANEPILRVKASLFEAQLVETYLLSVINYQTSVASKAARVILAARGRNCVEFGTRRAHGPQAALYAARATYLAGFSGTSNVLAGKLCDIPVLGTAAHAFIMACPSEEEAFRRYHASFPDHSTLLIDTYDTLRGARRAAAIPGELRGVRLDSGDMAALSKEVRGILDENGRHTTRIVASGDLNEDSIDTLLEAEAPIDVFGVGTEVVTSKDHPALGGVYKLVERCVQGQSMPTMKWSEGKMTYPGAKQVWRLRDPQGHYTRDVIQLLGSPPPAPDASPLLTPYIRRGEAVCEPPPLTALRSHCLAEVSRLPGELKTLADHATFPVEIGADIAAMVRTLQGEQAP